MLRRAEPPTAGRTARVLAILAALSVLTATPVALAAPAAAAGVRLDFTGVDAFWDIAATLQAGEPATDEQWDTLFATPGYAALLASEFPSLFFRDAFILALHPAMSDERAALEPGKLARTVAHVQRVAEQEEELRAWAAKLQAGNLSEVGSAALALVPEAWRDESPVIAFVIFDNDARGYDPIVVDLLASSEFDLEPFMAHESHHWIRNRHLAFDLSLVGQDDESLLWVLNQLQAEGVADRIDKAGWITGATQPPASRADYAEKYRAHVASAPDAIRALDALVQEAAASDELPDDFVDRLRQAIPQSGHPTGYFMADRIVAHHGEAALVESVGDPFAFIALYQAAALADPESAPPFSDPTIATFEAMRARVCPPADLVAELDRLVDADDKVFLFQELSSIDPPERIQELLAFYDQQHELGGGFHGLLPEPLDGVDTLPAPADAATVTEAAIVLAKRREANRTALLDALPTFPLDFRGDPIPPLEAIAPPAGWRVKLDYSAIERFLVDYGDIAFVPASAAHLAALPANREMLQHRADLGYVPPPLPTEENLATMIFRARSGDPLDALWSWLHPWNWFGYADIASNREGYARFIAALATDGDAMANAAAVRMAAYAPEGTTFDGTFALTIGALIRGWVTQAMPGLNVDQVKDDWAFLERVLVHETYHKVQPRICPTVSGEPATDFEDLAVVDLDDPGLAKLYEIVAYTVLEGTANYAAGPDGHVDDPAHARAGARLLNRFHHRVLVGGDLDAADELIVEGLRNNGPLYALGYQLSERIAAAEGSRAVGDWLAKGPLAFVRHAEELAGPLGGTWLSADVRDAVEELAGALE